MNMPDEELPPGSLAGMRLPQIRKNIYQITDAQLMEIGLESIEQFRAAITTELARTGQGVVVSYDLLTRTTTFQVLPPVTFAEGRQ